MLTLGGLIFLKARSIPKDLMAPPVTGAGNLPHRTSR
jgi:hypothetical protein